MNYSYPHVLITLKYFAKNIAFLRGLKNISQAEMADRLNFKRTTWNGYESGTSKPYIDGLVLIADYFGVSEGDLLHVDLSKRGKYLNKSYGTKKQGKSEYSGDYEGEYSAKKYSENIHLSVVNEDNLSSSYTADSLAKEGSLLAVLQHKINELEVRLTLLEKSVKKPPQ